MEENMQPKKKKKWSTGKIIAVIVAAVVLVFVLILCVSLVIAGRAAKTIEENPELVDQIAEEISNADEDTDTEPTDEEAADDVDEDSAVDMDVLKTYGKFSFTDEELIDTYYDLIVATVGEHELNGRMFQIFYWNQVNTFLNQYGAYISYLGLDTSVSMAEQDYGEDVTWEQHFVEEALNMYLQYCALYDEAQANGVTLSAESQSKLETLAEDLEEDAVNAGFESAQAYLQTAFGPGVTMDDYVEFNRLYSLAATYAAQIEDAIIVDEDEISAYFDENADSYAEQGIEKVDQNMVNVRHILIAPEEDIDTDEDLEPDSSSDEAWAAAQKSANEVYATWKLDPTEENFAKVAADNTFDTASAESGGLYEDIYPGQMVTEFNDWCFDTARKPGDTDIVKTDYGYHIMYFVGTSDEVYWHSVAESDCIDDHFYDELAEIFSRYKLNASFENLHIYDLLVVQAAAAASEEAAE